MKTPLSMKIVFRVVCPAALLLLLGVPLHAQWNKLPESKIPRAVNGKPNLSAPVPRTPDGHPDLSGIWERTEGKYLQNLGADLKPGDIPYQPWAKTLADQRVDGSHEKEDPNANCLPHGVPRISVAPPPWKIIQMPGLIVILYEAHMLWRQIFLDGRELSNDFPPAWLGYSTGKWDGDTLVVETKGFNGLAWLDQLGKPATEALHVTERFHRKDAGQMEIQVTIDDSKAYTRPWSITEHAHLLTDTELLEGICNENNRDLDHLPGNR